MPGVKLVECDGLLVQGTKAALFSDRRVACLDRTGFREVARLRESGSKLPHST